MRHAKRRALLGRLMLYPELIAETIVRRIGRDKLQKSFLCCDLPWSDQFSGQGTTYVAMRLLTKAFGKHGVQLRTRLLSTCERDRACQQFLQRQHPGVCNWADEDSGVTGMRSRRSDFSGRLAMDMARLRLSEKRLCTTHLRKCPVLHSQLRVGGTPCTDFSNAGKRKKLQGETIGCTISWLRQSAAAELSVHENVSISIHIITFWRKTLSIIAKAYIYIYVCVMSNLCCISVDAARSGHSHGLWRKPSVGLITPGPLMSNLQISGSLSSRGEEPTGSAWTSGWRWSAIPWTSMLRWRLHLRGKCQRFLLAFCKGSLQRELISRLQFGRLSEQSAHAGMLRCAAVRLRGNLLTGSDQACKHFGACTGQSSRNGLGGLFFISMITPGPGAHGRPAVAGMHAMFSFRQIQGWPCVWEQLLFLYFSRIPTIKCSMGPLWVNSWRRALLRQELQASMGWPADLAADMTGTFLSALFVKSTQWW